MPVKPKPILHTIESGASSDGFHSYLSVLGCPRKATLNRAAREEGDTVLERKSALSIGIIGHSYMELHFGKKLDPHVIQFSDVVDEEARFEAERCVRAFLDKYPSPSIFGKVLGVEESIESGDEAVEEAVGVSPYSARLDLRTSLTAPQIKNIEKQFETAGGKLTPGTWIWDHKFLARKDQYLVEKYSNSLQGVSYTLAADAKWKNVRGIVYNCIFKTKTPTFLLVVAPFPKKRLVKSLHTLYEHAVWIMENRPNQAIPTENNCFSFFSMCRWKIEGICPGY